MQLGQNFVDFEKTEGPKDMGVHCMTVPALVLQNRGLDPMVERGFLRGEQQTPQAR